MPLGTLVSDIGQLLRGPDPRFLYLHRDGGGVWRLDVGRAVAALVGQRVRVHGTRADFDLIDVDRAEPVTGKES